MQKPVIHYVHLAPDGVLAALDGLSPCKVVLVVEAMVADMTMWDISRTLVTSGCALLMAWGQDCEQWREAVDDAHLEATDYEDLADAQRVITTAHDDEELSEVFWYAKQRAVHPAHELRNTLILHIAALPRRDELEAAYHEA